MPLYSPFRAPHSPLDILQATVEREDRCRWGNGTVATRLVVYRGDPGSGRGGDETRGRMWVRHDGVVLRQEVTVFKTPIQFERLPESQARVLRRVAARRLVASDRFARGAAGPRATRGRPVGGRGGSAHAMIDFENVTRRYGSKVAVDALNLHVPRGELFAFLGPNGAGKTTTIKMMVGLLRPSSGTIRLCGHDISQRQHASNRMLGYVPDVPYLYDKLSGTEFLWFIADMYAMDRADAEQKIAQQVDVFQLHEFVDDLTESYSHGMKQRLAFAAALLHDPPVLVIDEPMVGLDPRSVRLVKDLLKARAAAGQTDLHVHAPAVDRRGNRRPGGHRRSGTLQIPGHDRRAAPAAGHARDVARATVSELHRGH